MLAGRRRGRHPQRPVHPLSRAPPTWLPQHGMTLQCNKISTFLLPLLLVTKSSDGKGLGGPCTLPPRHSGRPLPGLAEPRPPPFPWPVPQSLGARTCCSCPTPPKAFPPGAPLREPLLQGPQLPAGGRVGQGWAGCTDSFQPCPAVGRAEEMTCPAPQGMGCPPREDDFCIFKKLNSQNKFKFKGRG